MKALPLRLAPIVLLALLSASMQAEEPNAAQLQSWVAVRQQRVDLLREEIKQADVRIETRLGVLVATLMSIADSKESGTKAAQLKEETMKRLAKTIDSYEQQRRRFRQELLNPESVLTVADKRKFVAAFDARIELRVQQIVALSKLTPTRVATAGKMDSELNRSLTAYGNAQRDVLVKQLDTSIARLERMGQELRRQQAATTDPVRRKERAADVAKNDALIAERRRQKQEAWTSAGTAQRGVTLKEAADLDAAMKKSLDELRRDFTTLFQRFNTFVSELTALRANEARLAARRHGG